MENLKQILREEIPEFKKKGEAFLAGELKKMDFKKASGGFGVYAHRNGTEFMIRLRILSGVLSKEQLKLVADFAERFRVPMIHFTTRQAIQFHGLSLEAICDVMEEGLDHNIYTRGAGGNYPRNVAMSPLSGIDPDEVFDVVPYAMAANAYFLQRITSYHLPRKLKVAFSNSGADTGQCTIQDLGFIAEMKEGMPHFRIYIGGGLGRNPRKAIKVEKLLPAHEVLYALEAMVHLYEDEGDYENHSKARVRYIAERMGDEAFVKAYETYLERAKSAGGLELEVETPQYLKEGIEIDINHIAVKPQKQKGLYSYYFHPVGGQLDTAMLHKINEVIEPMKEVYGRLSMGEGIYLINLNGEEVKQVAKALDDDNHLIGVEKSRSCIGVPVCQMGVLESQTTLKQLVMYFKEKGYTKETIPPVYICGCPNSCSVHQIAGIGLVGKKKKIGDVLKGVYDVYVAGCCQEGATRLGETVGEIVEEYVPQALYELALIIDESGKDFFTFVQENNEVVVEHFKKYC